MTEKNVPKTFELFKAISFDPRVTEYVPVGDTLYPKEYTGWMDETLSWKESCYIHAGLSILMTRQIVTGPDAAKFLSYYAVSDFTKMAIGTGKHTIMCNEKGNIMCHGVTLRLGEEKFECYALQQYLDYCAEKAIKSGYDIQFNPGEYNDVVYQIAGPTSLQTIENAIQQDIHDLKFMQFVNAKIAGKDVRILRMGMGGTLAYEVQASLEDAQVVYDAVYDAGLPFGIKKLGELFYSYRCNHTENGYPQLGMHFPAAWMDDPEFCEWTQGKGIWAAGEDTDQENWSNVEPSGTLGDNVSDYFHNPIELGWGISVNLKPEHDFVGKAALQKIKETNTKKTVTLVWNPEDVLDVYASYLQKDEEPYRFLPFPLMDTKEGAIQELVTNKDGMKVGQSEFYVYTLFSREVISMGVIESEYAEEGTEVIIHWGEPGKRIKKIRATVAPFPRLSLTANRDFDIDSIPRFKK